MKNATWRWQWAHSVTAIVLCLLASIFDTCTVHVQSLWIMVKSQKDSNTQHKYSGPPPLSKIMSCLLSRGRTNVYIQEQSILCCLRPASAITCMLRSWMWPDSGVEHFCSVLITLLLAVHQAERTMKQHVTILHMVMFVSSLKEWH